MTDFGRAAGDMLKSVYDPDNDGVIAIAHTQADMTKAVYDSDDDGSITVMHTQANMETSTYDPEVTGIVADARKLENSTKAQVQDHTPKAHAHSESEILDLLHDATKIQGKAVDDTDIGDGKTLTYQLSGDKIVYVPAIAGAHKASHQDGGADEINCAGLVGRVNLVDRGDPSDWDWDTSDFTADAAWHDLDCSAIVPAGASRVWLRISFKCAVVGSTFVLRKKGQSSSYNALAVTAQFNAIAIECHGFLGCDTNRFIQYYLPSAIGPTVGVVVRGWVI